MTNDWISAAQALVGMLCYKRDCLKCRDGLLWTANHWP